MCVYLFYVCFCVFLCVILFILKICVHVSNSVSVCICFQVYICIYVSKSDVYIPAHLCCIRTGICNYYNFANEHGKYLVSKTCTKRSTWQLYDYYDNLSIPIWLQISPSFELSVFQFFSTSIGSLALTSPFGRTKLVHWSPLKESAVSSHIHAKQPSIR